MKHSSENQSADSEDRQWDSTRLIVHHQGNHKYPTTTLQSSLYSTTHSNTSVIPDFIYIQLINYYLINGTQILQNYYGISIPETVVVLWQNTTVLLLHHYSV